MSDPYNDSLKDVLESFPPKAPAEKKKLMPHEMPPRIPYYPISLGEEISVSENPQDAVLRHLTKECDRLGEILNTGKPGRRNRVFMAATSVKRVQALKILSEELEKRRQRNSGGDNLPLVAQLINLFIQCMSEHEISEQNQQLIVGKLAQKIETTKLTKMIVEKK